jgi:acetyl-CoA carboxylase biotin carboxylase subunit
LRRALDEIEIGGVATTLALHRRLVELEDVRQGRFDTGYLERLLAHQEAPGKSTQSRRKI